MSIIGSDFHPRYQRIAVLEEATGEIVGRRRGSGRAAVARGARQPLRRGQQGSRPRRDGAGKSGYS